ncbi:cytidine deaminase [Pseudidiomarina mangrovi]|uniref:cytidine deaminase n=1 Tax=Pseudidiomarina mangrovi TaxID=2487133 RepID=UPI000FCA8AEB|nr:cytidine deaminase [Pseudidiomarina mangrovi]
MNNEQLTERLAQLKSTAQAVSQHAYAPYSQFPVGAVVLLKDGRQFSGCNVENASYGLTNCAERTAIFAAIAAGVSADQFAGVVIYTPSQPAYAPCGACRQVIAEFFAADAPVLSFSDADQRHWQVQDLLPDAFSFQPGGSLRAKLEG